MKFYITCADVDLMMLNEKEFHREGFSNDNIILILWIEALKVEIDFAFVSTL